MNNQQIKSHRDMCYLCFKPAVACVCNKLTIVSNKTAVYIVQHMRERFHPLGTERIASLGLEKVFLETVFPTNRRFTASTNFPKNTALLYPSAKAEPIETLPSTSIPSSIVVIDGTWSQASKIYRDSPALRALPCLTFGNRMSGNYRIRKEPFGGANSTIEAVVRALKILEPETEGLDTLLSAFDLMIDDQLRLSAFKQIRTLRRSRDVDCS